MITETVLQGTPREKVGKGPARQLRAAGQIPVTLYGGGKDPISVGINARELAAILRSESGRNSIFTLDVPAGSSPVMIKQLDRDPVTGRILHADFVRISMTETTRSATVTSTFSNVLRRKVVQWSLAYIAAAWGIGASHMSRERRCMCTPRHAAAHGETPSPIWICRSARS